MRNSIKQFIAMITWANTFATHYAEM